MPTLSSRVKTSQPSIAGLPGRSPTKRRAPPRRLGLQIVRTRGDSPCSGGAAGGDATATYESRLRCARAATIRRAATILLTGAIASATFLVFSPPATAAIVATVPLATCGQLFRPRWPDGHQHRSERPRPEPRALPGYVDHRLPARARVLGTTDTTNAAAAQAQSDSHRGVQQRGRASDRRDDDRRSRRTSRCKVASTPDRATARSASPVRSTLDGAGDPSTVFIFQTNSSLITASGSTVALINGAQECNVFWQVGSSATLGTGSTFTGNILALTSITVNNSVTVHGRALARNGAVTLDDDTFTSPSCATSPVTTTTTTATSATTAPGGAGPGAGTGDGSGSGTGTGTGTGSGAGSGGGSGSDVPAVTGPPRTGVAPVAGPSFPWSGAVLAGLLGVAGSAGRAQGPPVPARRGAALSALRGEVARDAGRMARRARGRLGARDRLRRDRVASDRLLATDADDRAPATCTAVGRFGGPGAAHRSTAGTAIGTRRGPAPPRPPVAGHQGDHARRRDPAGRHDGRAQGAPGFADLGPGLLVPGKCGSRRPEHRADRGPRRRSRRTVGGVRPARRTRPR